MRRTLGLDIGTNSIGWCLTEADKRIVDIGVRIFGGSPTGAGRDPKSGTSLAVDRREARAARRSRDRYIRRRSVFLETLIGYGLMPADADEAKLIAALDPYVLRSKALDEALAPYEIGRALFHLNQRRGFKSNRKAERKTKDAEDGKIATGRKKLDAAMEAAIPDPAKRTLGRFLKLRLDADLTARVRMGTNSQEYDFYPQRAHVEHEFDRIWEEQATHHPALLTEAARKRLHDILFFQRPLKEQAVGLCTFVNQPPNQEYRLAKAHPLFQQRRLYEEVNQLRITTPGAPDEPLTLAQRDKLVLKLSRTQAVKFDSLAKLLKLDPGQSFNKASETRTQLAGDEVRAVLGHKDRFGDAWEHFDRDRQWEIVERLIEETDPDALHAFLTDDCGLDDPHATATAKASLPEGHGRLGPTATARILAELKAEVINYDEAVRRCGWNHSDDRTGEILAQLPYYGELLTRDIPPGTLDPADPIEKRWGKITNPTVHIGLRQLEKLVNAIIAVHGRPDQIVVELARELKLNEKDKEEENRKIRRNTLAAQDRSKKLIEEGFADTGANRMLLRLWEDLAFNPLDRRCPYCAQPIGLRMLFSGEADIDHIIPYSRSLDDSAGNKVVAHRHCNREKGNRTPYEKWGHDEDRWETISTQVARIDKRKQWRFGPDAMARVEKDGGFLARQLTDTQYLSRLAGRYLGSLYATKDEGSVYVIPGRMTAMLRRLWGLNSLLPDHNIVDNKHSDAPKNRLDHRHHAIDAAVVAVTTRSLLQQIARTAGLAEDKHLDRLFEGLDPPWPEFRNELWAKLDTIVISHKPDHGRKGKPAPGRDSTSARLHNDTAYGITRHMSADGKTPIVVHRIPLASIKPADLTNPDRISDVPLREALYRATKGLSGKAYDKALKDFSDTGSDERDRNGDPLFQKIRRVRVREALNVIPIKDKAGRIYKAYKGSANDRFEIWRMPDGKWQSEVITTFEAHQAGAPDRRPHPAAKKVLSLKQNDVIAIERNSGARELMVVKQIWPKQVSLVGHLESGNLIERHRNEEDRFRFFSPTAGGLKKLRARQVRIDPLGRIFDPGPR